MCVYLKYLSTFVSRSPNQINISNDWTEKPLILFQIEITFPWVLTVLCLFFYDHDTVHFIPDVIFNEISLYFLSLSICLINLNLSYFTFDQLHKSLTILIIITVENSMISTPFPISKSQLNLINVKYSIFFNFLYILAWSINEKDNMPVI